MTLEQILAEAKADDFHLNNLFELEDGRFRCKWMTKYTGEKDVFWWFSKPVTHENPLEAMRLSLEAARLDRPPDEENAVVDLGLFS